MDQSTQTRITFGQRRSERVLRSRPETNLTTETKPVNVEEEIIQKRGRRPKVTPTTSNNRKRHANEKQMTNDLTNASPFTKCLRGLMSPIPQRDSLPSESNLSKMLMTSDAAKRFYFSPNPPYQLRSMDVSKSMDKFHLNDSGIEMTPDAIGKNHSSNNESIDSFYSTSDTDSNHSIDKSLLAKSSSSKPINRVRRRFRF
ncbi:hypothetical protein SSS_04634 [Sarcoptes scabiei]|uniref:Uncharacterized protein n=1 Tax=Sarcoptes scabiei TaxID=52283 RepID=A0A834RF08_SARSC|nr:hypothetical protein SSS_04634 [Sarcoptes scabiei]